MSAEDEVRKKTPPTWLIPIIARMRATKALAAAARLTDAPEDPEAIHQAYLQDIQITNKTNETRRLPAATRQAG